MTKIRTFKKFTLFYNIEINDKGYTISITKESAEGREHSAFNVWGEERELKALLCRMWSCSVTPMSLRYILQDEGFLPQPVEEDKLIHISASITKRPPIRAVADKELTEALTGKH